MGDQKPRVDESDRLAVEYACSALGGYLDLTLQVDDERPDQQVRDRKAIDFTASDTAGNLVGIEHTLIEPYVGHITDMTLAEERLGEARRRLEGRLPQDSVFDIAFPAGSARLLKSREAPDVAAWVWEVAPSLEIGRPGRIGHSLDSPPGRFAVTLTLRRWPRDFPGPQVRYRVGVMTETSEDMARPRIVKAMADKLPKLESSRTDLAVQQGPLDRSSPDQDLRSPGRSQA